MHAVVVGSTPKNELYEKHDRANEEIENKE